MIQLDPDMRKMAEDYLALYKGACFPYYFHAFVHQYLHSITDHTNPSMTDPDSRFDRIVQDFDKIAFFLGFLEEEATTNIPNHRPDSLHGDPESLPPSEEIVDNLSMDMTLNIPNFAPFLSGKTKKQADEGALIFVSVICSAVRNLRFPSSKLSGLDCLLAIGVHLKDGHKLERIVPYLVALTGDRAPIVRACAVRTLTQLLSTVEKANIPFLSPLLSPKEIIVYLARYHSQKQKYFQNTFFPSFRCCKETQAPWFDQPMPNVSPPWQSLRSSFLNILKC